MNSTSSAQDFIKRAVEFREEGRFDEALVAARRATSLDSEDANGWWQLALSTWERDGPAAAVPHLQKTVEIADGFAHGWHRLGNAYNLSALADKAIECWEQALAIEDERSDTLAALVEAYGKRDKAGDDDKRFELLKRLEALGKVDGHDWNLLGIGYYNRSQHQRAIQCYRRYAVEWGGHIPFFNLGLALNSNEVQQRTDAVDAWRRALLLSPDDTKSQSQLDGVVPKALELRQKVLAGRRVLLAQDEWYAHYLNPYELLWLMGDDEDLADLEPKAIQKAKKRLLQEIELEDGVVEWMPGLKIDRSRAMKIADELLSDDVAEHQRTIAENRELCSFLSQGDIGFFLVHPEESPVALLDSFDNEFSGLAPWLSERFAPQFDLVLTKAIEARDVNAIEALLSGRRLVTPEREDRCFEGAQRQVARMLEPLRAASEKAVETKPTAAFINALLAKDNLGRIVSVLPQYFQDVQSELASLIRTISITAHNDHGDTDTAKEILAIGRSLAGRSPALLHQMQEDADKLDEMIKEQSKNDASLQFGTTTYSITRKGVAFGTKSLALPDANSICWGTVYIRDANGTGAKFNLEIGGKDNSRLQLTWTTYKDVEKQIELFNTMSSAAMNYLMPPIIERLHEELQAGRVLRIATALCSKEGIHFTLEGWFNSKKYVCPWSRLKSDVENGDLVVFDLTERKARHQMPLATTDNAFALFLLINSYKDK